MNPKTVKSVLKITLMLTSALAYGFAHKAEKKIGEKIDDHYSIEPKPDQDKN